MTTVGVQIIIAIATIVGVLYKFWSADKRIGEVSVKLGKKVDTSMCEAIHVDAAEVVTTEFCRSQHSRMDKVVDELKGDLKENGKLLADLHVMVARIDTRLNGVGKP